MTASRTAHNAREVGRRIAALREAMSLSAAQFARHTGITAQALHNYESGLRRISLDQAILVCDRTGSTLDWIYFGDPSGLPLRFASLGRPVSNSA